MFQVDFNDSVDVQKSVLSDFGSADDVVAQLPTVSGIVSELQLFRIRVFSALAVKY